MNTVPTKADYCDVDPKHSKCIHLDPNPRCDIIKRLLSEDNQKKFIEKINE